MLRRRQGKLVFVSCGQFSESEKRLGQKIVAAVDRFPPLKGYFAENQASLEGLTDHVFSALDEAVGLVAVLHPRGRVTRPDGTITRASVWVEQEIAIAAFLRQTLHRSLDVVAFSAPGLHREGVRETVILNPITFSSDDDVMCELDRLLPVWAAKASRDRVSIELKWARVDARPGEIDYELEAFVSNGSSAPLERYKFEVSFPRILASRYQHFVSYTECPGTDDCLVLRVTTDDSGECLFPDDRVKLLAYRYTVSNSIFRSRVAKPIAPVVARLWYGAASPAEATLSFDEMHDF